MSKRDFIALAKAIMLHNKMARFNGWTEFSADQIETLANF